MGLPGALGSTDCILVKWERQFCTESKELSIFSDDTFEVKGRDGNTEVLKGTRIS